MTNKHKAYEKDDELRSLLKRVRRIELMAKKKMNSSSQGAYQSRFKGRGMAFEESRQYVPGDDPRHIDWNVSARSEELYVKQFVEERELTLLIAVDISASNSFGSRSNFKAEMAAEAAALLAFSALKNNDKVGLILFAQGIEKMIRPGKGKAHVLRMIREILSAKASGQKTQIEPALKKLGFLSKQRAIVTVISDWIEDDLVTQLQRLSSGKPEQYKMFSWEKALRILARRHDVLSIHLQDPLELEFPDIGLIALVDPESQEKIVVDTGNKKLKQFFRKGMLEEQQRLAQTFKRLAVDYLPVQCGEDTIALLIRFLARRSKGGA